MKLTRARAVVCVLLLSASPAVAQQMNHDMMNGMSRGSMMGMPAMPAEAGQSAFAAIQEIVTILRSDPQTDWFKVDIEALRQHLIDMNNVTLQAKVEAREDAGRMRFVVTGDGPVGDSIRRMVLAHAATMNGVEGWQFTAESTANGADLMVTPPDAAHMAELRGLGFIGVLASGMHHQMHHLMIARGQSPHG